MIAPLIDELAVEYAGKLKAVRGPASRPVSAPGNPTLGTVCQRLSARLARLVFRLLHTCTHLLQGGGWERAQPGCRAV